MLSAMAISDSAKVLIVYFLAALLHEIGHLTAAKLLKLRVTEIRFDFSGVRICIDEKITSYKEEFLLALSGPLANLLSAITAMGICMANGHSSEEVLKSGESFLNDGEGSPLGIAGFFIISAIVQLVTNLLPIESFDGGRMLYCAVSFFAGERAGERISSIMSAFAAFLLWTVALYLMLKISAGLGIYVFALCIFFGTLSKKDFG